MWERPCSRRLSLFLALTLVLAAPLRTLAAGPSPSQTAETIRAALVQTELGLISGSATASDSLASAQAAYAGDFALLIAQADSAAAGRIQAGFADLAAALERGDAPSLSAARAQVWTGILAGSYAIVEQAAVQGDAVGARQWLPVREFRQATRFSRPGASATLALERLARGEMSPADAVLTLRADLFDTYQARLGEALNDLEAAQGQGFAVRAAEHAALAQGYFALLAPAYAEQKGLAAGAELQQRFAGLRAAVLAGQPAAALLGRLQAELNRFRAAPLSPDELSRRAGQVLRYLSLVPVEYGRGVAGDRVTQSLEITEAVTFHAGAEAAFADLRSELERLDPARTAQAAGLFSALDDQLSLAATQPEGVPPAAEVRANAESLSKLLRALMPTAWQVQSAASDFDVVATLLDQLDDAVRAGRYDLAESARLEAYAVMETGPEGRLVAFAPQLKLTLEGLFWNGQGARPGLARLLSQRAPLSAVQATRAELDARLAEAQTLLSQRSAPAAVATNAGLIVFREGLEAVIILASLLSSLKGATAHLRRPLWLGTLGALLATLLTWLLARGVLLALARYGEMLEAVVSLIAIGVLLLITNWFFHKVYWTEWMAHFHARKKRVTLARGAAGLWLGLVALGFTSVYREGFETVLFLQALVLDAGNGPVLAGVAAGSLLVVLIGLLVFKLQVALPQKKMLVFTGILIGGVLLTMVGNTVHVLQVVGWLPLHPILSPPLPFWMGLWFGLYPTWEGLLLQAAAAVFVVGSYLLAERQRGQERPAPAPAVRRAGRIPSE